MKIDKQTVLHWLYNTAIVPMYGEDNKIKDENITYTALGRGSIRIELKNGRKFKVVCEEVK